MNEALVLDALVLAFLFGSVLLAVTALNFIELRHLRKQLRNSYLYSAEIFER